MIPVPLLLCHLRSHTNAFLLLCCLFLQRTTVISTTIPAQYCDHNPGGQESSFPAPAAIASNMNQPCWISTMPDEILSEIFEHFPICNSLELKTKPKISRVPLEQVCKRWQCVYKPILFRTIGMLETIIIVVVILDFFLRLKDC